MIVGIGIEPGLFGGHIADGRGGQFERGAGTRDRGMLAQVRVERIEQ